MKIEKVKTIEEIGEVENELRDGSLLLIASPSSGKTHDLIETFKGRAEFMLDTETKSVHGVQDHARNENILIIDDIFRLIVEGKYSEILEAAKNRRVCAVTTTYRGEWLLKLESREGILSELEIQKIVLYRIDDKKARDKIQKLAEKLKLSKVIDDKRLNELVKLSKHVHEFDRELEFFEKRKYENYPVCWLAFSPETLWNIGSAEIGEVLKKGLKGAGESFMHSLSVIMSKKSTVLDSIVRFFDSVSEALPITLPNLDFLENALKKTVNVFSEHKKEILEIGLAATGCGFLFGLLELFFLLRRGKEKVFREFGRIVHLPPHKLEEIEKKAGLPPMTLFTLKSLLLPRYRQKILKLVDEFEELEKEFEEFKKEFEELQQSFNEFGERIKEISRRLGEVELITNIIKEIAKESVEDTNRFEELIFSHIHALTGINPKRLYERKFGERYVRVEKIDEVLEEIERGKRIVVIKGKHCTGKTTLAFLLSKELESRGYLVRRLVRDVSRAEEYFAYVRRGTDYSGSVLVIDSLTDSDEYWRAIGLVLEGLIDVLMVTCDSGIYDALERSLLEGGKIREIRRDLMKMGLRSLDEIKCTVTLKPDVEFTQRVLRLLSDGLKVDASDEDIRRISELSEGFVTYAVIGLGLLISGDVSKIRHEMVDERIDQIFAEVGEGGEKVLTHAAVFGKLHVNDAMQLTETDVISVACRREGEFVRVVPDLISHRIFERSICGGMGEEDEDEVILKPSLERYLKSEIFQKSEFKDEYILGVARNFIESYLYPDESIKDCISNNLMKFLEWLNRLEDSLYAFTIDLLSYAAPLDFNLLNAEKFSAGCKHIVEFYVKEFEKRGLKAERTAALPACNVISRIVRNKLRLNLSPAGKFMEDCTSFSLEVAERIKEPKPLFMENMLSMCIFQISDEKTPEEAKEWVDEIVERGLEVAERIKEPKPLFMENMLSMCISRISSKKTPEEAKEWVDEIVKRAEALGKEFGSEFVGAFWFMCLYRIYESFRSNPEHYYPWLKLVVLRGIEEIEKHYLELSKFEGVLGKNLALWLAEVCTALIEYGRMVDDDIGDVEKVCF